MGEVIHNTESAIRQYHLCGKAIALGWAADQITVIDIDQGHSGSSPPAGKGSSRWSPRCRWAAPPRSRGTAALLDDPVFFAPFAPYFDPLIGWPSTPVECYLRLMFLKFRYRLGYESLCAEVSYSISWRRFCRISLDGRVPHPATLMKLTTRRGSAAVAGLNEALLAKAAGQKLLRTARLHRHHGDPGECGLSGGLGLLARVIRRIGAAGRRIQAVGGATRTRVRDRSRAAGRRALRRGEGGGPGRGRRPGCRCGAAAGLAAPGGR